MAKVYYNRIKAGIMEIDAVPARWKEAVKALLKADEEVVPE